MRELRATHDADAIEQIELMRMPLSCELWHRSRFVLMLPATAAEPA